MSYDLGVLDLKGGAKRSRKLLYIVAGVVVAIIVVAVVVVYRPF
ncbi:MAG: hypothetical protein ACT4OI_07780 [Methanobacteriota archaeon]